MKIIDRDTFLTFPSGTVFSKYERSGCFGQLSVKTCNPGFWSEDFCDMELHGGWIEGCSNSGQLFDKINAAEKGEEFRFSLDTDSRDGLFEEDQLFAVYDNEDIQRLMSALQQCIK